jgi:hypothetical protein
VRRGPHARRTPELRGGMRVGQVRKSLWIPIAEPGPVFNDIVPRRILAMLHYL